MSIRDNINDDCIVYSPNKYRETEGRKDSFNAAHSMAYSLLTYKTAYLKAHYPVEFFCALLNKNKDDYGAVNKYIIDANSFGVKISPPHINKSEMGFSVDNGKILFGLSAISGVGEKLAKIIIEERNENGTYKNFNDFLQRVKPNKTVVISLVKSGAIPCNNKKTMLLSYAKTLFPIKSYTPVKTLPKLSILKNEYGIDTNDKQERLRKYNIYRQAEFDIEQQYIQNKKLNEFSEQYLQDTEYWEFETLSVFLSSNPFTEGDKYITRSYQNVSNGSSCVIIGVIANVQKKKDRNKQQFAFINVYSTSGLIEITVWASVYKQYADYIVRGNKVALLCEKQNENSCQLKDIKMYEEWLSYKKRKER